MEMDHKFDNSKSGYIVQVFSHPDTLHRASEFGRAQPQTLVLVVDGVLRDRTDS